MYAEGTSLVEWEGVSYLCAHAGGRVSVRRAYATSVHLVFGVTESLLTARYGLGY